MQAAVLGHLDKGIDNGFFNLNISGTIGHNGKRIVDVKYADNERFSLPEEEIHDN
jgi:hypothetical protein